ncbi:MAG: four helix bundle protein [Gemmatimonadales bacterium]
MNSYERLEAWRAGHELVLLIYRTTQSFPKEERYGLTSQARRAAFAIPANIAEGCARGLYASIQRSASRMNQ